MDKTCRECGEPLRGRSDKKFCSDHCRNSFNNRLNGTTHNYMRRVNYALGRNRRILAQCIGEGERMAHREELLQKGFNFQYLTHTCRMPGRGNAFFCYEYGYSQERNGMVRIIKKK